MKQNGEKRSILCIDLKSFFATAECVDRGLDPFSYPLVVANPKQGNGAITLAVTPYLKNLGVKGRSRLYEIPKNIKYEIVPPRMSLYSKLSKEVVDVYLSFVAEEDLYVYSIDEAWLDVTDYLSFYQKDDYALALEILDTITKKTGLYGSCGIGPNMFLAKVAMDTQAKKYHESIAKWIFEDVEKELWEITPLSKIWGIGPRVQSKLNNLGIYKMRDLAFYNKAKLEQKFGVMGLELHNHANGIDNRRIRDWKEQPKDKSYSHSQVLFKDYNGNNIKLIIEEMVDVICARLRETKKEAQGIGFGIGYSKTVGGSFYHMMKLNVPTSSTRDVVDICFGIFDKYYDNSPIRRVTIAFSRLEDKRSVQLDLFQNHEVKEKEDSINSAVDTIKNKYGKNSLIKASSLFPDSTAIERNKKKGGHSL